VTLVAALITSIGIAAASSLLVLSLQSGLVAGLDDTASARAAVAAHALARGDTATAVAAPGGDSLVQLIAEDGTVLAASPPLVGEEPLVQLPVAEGEHQQPDSSLGERDVRLLTRTTGPGRPVVVVVSPLADVQEAITQLLRRLLVGAPLLLALICSAVWVLLGYTLRTVDRLRAQVASLSASGLDRRVEVPAARDGVRQLAETMNDLLDRLQQSALAQRRFVADAAHELRTPLAALRTRLEVSERAADLSRWQDAAPTLIDSTDRLGRLVDDLLALARLDESRRLRRVVPVDLDEIVFAEARRWRDTGRVVVNTSGVSAVRVDGDPDLLTRVVANLLSNAVRHAATRVQVALSTSDGQVELTVADDGPGVPPAERERVFERFHRLDVARARDSGGSGLGLAIVRDAVLAHGGSVVLQDNGPGAVVTVWMPLTRLDGQAGPAGE
jgi:signal transduction histidine kinase